MNSLRLLAVFCLLLALAPAGASDSRKSAHASSPAKASAASSSLSPEAAKPAKAALSPKKDTSIQSLASSHHHGAQASEDEAEHESRADASASSAEVTITHSHLAQERHRAHRQGGQPQELKHRVVQLDGEEEGDEEADDDDEGDDEDTPWIFAEDDKGVSHLGLIFLVTGFITMSVAAVFSLVMTLRYDGEKDARPDGPIYYYLVFFVTAVSTLAYHSMWEENALLHVHENDGVRVIFPERYVDAALTHSMIIVAISYLGKASTASMVGMLGSDFLMIGSLYVGGVLTPEHKFFWWGAGVVFFVLLLYLLLIELGKATSDGRVSEYDADTLRIITYTNLVCWAMLPFLWLIGQSGTASASLTTEIALSTCFDLLSKLVFCGTLLARLPAEGATNYGANYGSGGRTALSSAFV